jgi:opacity protein-like surface antigen
LKMMKAGLLALGLFAYAVPAHAQMKWTNKGFVAADFGVQVGTHEFDNQSEFSLYEENGQLQTAQEGKTSPFIQFRGGYKVWKNLVVGLGYSWTSSKSDVAITAGIPDPAVFDHLRTASLTVGDASTSEGALDFSGTWMVPVTDKIDVGVLAGPTLFFVKKDIVSSVTATEPGPVATAVISEESETGVGFHLGLDVHYTINPRYAVGGLARYSYGKADMSTGEAKAGGFQIGAGIRYRF